jgi:Golgi apparatus protein 1
LQKNYEKIEDNDCKEAIQKVTKSESKDIRLDQALIKNCQAIIDTECADEKTDDGNLFECLVKEKNNPNTNEKCKAGIEHHQLINLEDVRFNYKFIRNCKPNIEEFCSGEEKKIDVVECLSQIVLDDTLGDGKHRVDDKCRKQLTFERLQLNEDARLNPGLMQLCEGDIQQFCANVPFGRGQVLECLKNSKGLSIGCSEALAKRETVDLRMQKADYRLKETCSSSIKTLCDTSNDEEYLPCLRKYLNDPKLDATCRQVVINRIMFQNKDARLNPSLWNMCKSDIQLSCTSELMLAEAGEKLNGRIIKCLKEQFVKRKLTKQCGLEVDNIMREAASVDNRLDPILTDACTQEIQEFCSNQAENEKENCLRVEFQKGSIPKDSECGKVRFL